ncbi:related to MTW1 Determining metaphase spindle length [Cephalotrichum gorgonifer]|uniref:Related to MTW1 Determining metaphase spindle length n=1 Tax=Cephalotrichum gorgonifer TaxID=2041049 RepID=A0AAE8SX63_9PEZI|nr:related to MTW1 Determining metaphase spindle length [Cephalotrichum gorgonifer]
MAQAQAGQTEEGAAQTAQQTDVGLLTEHFGYPPVSLLDDIINSINILAESALESIEKFLLSHPPKSLGFREPKPSSATSSAPSAAEAARFEIDNGTHQLETLLCSSVDRTFDIFELYVMRNLLCVSPQDRNWIRLRHYEGLDFDRVVREGVAGSGSSPSVESVEELWGRVRASQRLNLALRAERAKNEALLRKLRGVLGEPSAGAGGVGAGEEQEKEKAPLAFLAELGSLTEGGSKAPIETTTAFALSQLQALRSLSASLKNMTPDLLAMAEDAAAAEGEGGGGPGEKSWRRERVEYVESQTRKHLEHARGLELGPQGEVRDGEWQGGGRAFARREVEALEKVGAALGGEKSGDAMNES